MNYSKYGLWVQRRIITIERHWTKNSVLFLILGEAFNRHDSVVFDCLIKWKNNVEYNEFFLEISKQEDGFSDSDLKVFDLKSYPRPFGTAHINFVRPYTVDPKNKTKAVFVALVYNKLEKLKACWEYSDFVDNYFQWQPISICQKLIDGIERMITDFHKKGLLLPPCWDTNKMVFLTKDFKPVLLGSGSVIDPENINHFMLGKTRDKKILNKLKWRYSCRITKTL